MPFSPNVPQEQSFTMWKNGTDVPVTMDLFVGFSAGPSGRVRYTLQPGETKSIPSEFDRGVQHLDEHGTIIGGFGPTLTNLGKPATPNPIFDADKLAQKQLLADAEAALLAKRTAEEALLIAASRTAPPSPGKK